MKILGRTRTNLENWGIDTRAVLTAVNDPTHVFDEPPNDDRDYAVRRYLRDGLEVCVSLERPADPMITWVRLHMPEEGAQHGLQKPEKSEARQKAPTTINEFRKRVRAAGYRPRTGGRHTRIERPNGSLLISMAITPSDHRSLLNSWADFKRAVAADQASDHAAAS